VKIVMTKKLAKLAIVMTATMFVKNLTIQKVYAREVDLYTLCQKFPLNSRCQGYQFPQATTNQVPQVIKLRLKTSGPDNEWIRFEKIGNTVKLMHTTRAQTTFSQVINGIVSAAPIPLPRIFNFYQWYDHPTTRVAFEPDIAVLFDF
jgi:hypothetical protein